MEKAMAPHSSTLAWKIPRMEEPGGLQSMGLLRFGNDWVTSLSCIGDRNGNPLQCSCLENPRDGGLPSMGSHRVRHNWNDLAAAAATGSRNWKMYIKPNGLIKMKTTLEIKPSNLRALFYQKHGSNSIQTIYCLKIMQDFGMGNILSTIKDTVIIGSPTCDDPSNYLEK